MILEVVESVGIYANVVHLHDVTGNLVGNQFIPFFVRYLPGFCSSG